MSPRGDIRSLVKQQTCRKTAFDLPQARRTTGDDDAEEDFGDLLGNSKTTFVKMAQQAKPASVRKGGNAKADHTDAAGLTASAAMGLAASTNKSKLDAGVLLQAIQLKMRNPRHRRELRKQRREQLSAKRSSVLAARQAYDPAAHPNGRISKIFRQFPGNDWMEQRIREHKVVAVVQGIVRGVQTRTWFRTSLSAAAEKITNRDFFKRLANIGALQRSLSTTKSGTSNLNVDRLAQQMRDEEEEEAMEFVRRNRRQGDVALDAEELKVVGQRFNRIGKEKTQSGAAYQEMTKNVIVSGTTKRKLKMYGGSTDVFKPPSVHYDPFAKPLVDTHKRTKKPAPEEAAVPRIRSVIPARVPNALHAVLQFQTGGSEGAPAIASVRPPSVDSNLSDWTDCDSDEFDTMQAKMNVPEHSAVDWRLLAGRQERLRYGHYRAAGDDVELIRERLDALEPLVDSLRTQHTAARGGDDDDDGPKLPDNVIRDMLAFKYAATQARVGAPIYSTVGWKRAPDEVLGSVRPPPLDEAARFG